MRATLFAGAGGDDGDGHVPWRRDPFGLPDDIPVYVDAPVMAPTGSCSEVVAGPLELLVAPKDAHGAAEGLGGGRVVRLAVMSNSSPICCAIRHPLGTLGGLSLIVPIAVRTAVGEEAVTAGVVIAVLRR
ncbi:MAG: hypothetical protein ACRDZO_06315 [Egibacteraceae bacterium]